jgi:hypothetical protein
MMTPGYRCPGLKGSAARAKKTWRKISRYRCNGAADRNESYSRALPSSITTIRIRIDTNYFNMNKVGAKFRDVCDYLNFFKR